MVTKKKVRAVLAKPAKDLHVKDESLRSFGHRNMKIYGTEVNLNRSVPDLFDGLKPVQRRILWACSKVAKAQMEKTARLSGECMGKYHPHGSSAIEGAIVTMVQQPTPTMLGRGNWGTMTDGAAAARYTNCRLSAYGQTFFDNDYINDEVTSFVPNYDDKDVEPVMLPAQLPNILLNGGEGPGVGIKTCLPTFTAESVIEVLEALLKGDKLQPVDFAKRMKYAHKWGGVRVKGVANRAAWLQLFTGSLAGVLFESRLDINREKKQITISDWPPGTNLEKFVLKVRTFPETLRCINTKGSATFTIDCKPAYNYDQFDKFVEKVTKATQKKVSFRINATRRKAQTVDGVTTYEVGFLAPSVPELLIEWLKDRIALESRSLEYRIRKVENDIDYQQTMIHACGHIDQIVKTIRRSMEPEASVAKVLKIELYQAKWICDLQLRRISRLDENQYKDKLAKLQAELKQLNLWLKKPKSKVLQDIQGMRDIILKDRSYQDKEDTQELVVV